jgi:hypothetical protein
MSSTPLHRIDEAASLSREDVLARWADAIAVTLGADVLLELVGFARTAGAGAMMTIRCTRDGFTAQVTGPIIGGRVRALSDEVVVLMDQELDQAIER